MQNEPQDKMPPPKMATIAQIDANGIYQGTTQIPESELTSAHVHLPQGCDLPPGQHRWDAEKKTFVALQQGEDVERPDPHALRAIALGFISLHDAGLSLEQKTLEWLDFYTSAMDFAGPLSDQSLAMVKRYWNSRKGG